MARTVHVYTGPTLSAADVSAVLPGAVVHPPVAAGDLLTLDASHGDVVVILDGYFQSAQAVRHKEILLLVERGVEVWGAASMGALRAAELHRLGMRGTGTVFRLYTLGIIEGDDEVGVTHGPAERGYPVVADAMVNIRCTMRRAVRTGLLTAADAAVFTAAAAALPFERRTREGLLDAARGAGLGTATVARVEAALTEHHVDVKRRDALRVLRRVRSAPVRALAAAIPTVRVSDNAHLHLWRESSRPDDRHALAACQLYAADYPDFAAGVALRTLAALASPQPRQQRSDAELLATVANDDEALVRFLTAHHLGRDELLRHLRREERLTTALRDRPCTPEVLAGIVSNAAAEHGVLSDADAQRWERRHLRAAERQLPDRRTRAALRTFSVPPGLVPREPFIVALKLSGRYAAALATARAALAFNDELAAARPEFAVHQIDAGRVSAWFAERWGVTADEFDRELADRSFAGRDEFLPVARAFYMADKFRPQNTVLSLTAAAAA